MWHFVPYTIRRSAWSTRWFIANLRSDYQPRVVIFDPDYELYWQTRQSEGQLDISYSELIKVCASEVPYGARVLDFGCGAGQLLVALRQEKKIDGLGLDLSDTAVMLAKDKGIDAHQCELKKPEDLERFGHFDIAIATEVLEHSTSAELILIALANVADKVLISIPNTGYLQYRLRLLAGRFPRQWIVHPAEHVRFWTLADFCQTAKLTDCEVEKVIGIAGGWLGRRLPSLAAPDLLFVLKPQHRVM
jgi:methionine biosynthesis protein MetW